MGAIVSAGIGVKFPQRNRAKGTERDVREEIYDRDWLICCGGHAVP